MVNGDDRASLSDALGVDVDGRFRERGVDIVDRDGVVRVGSAVHQLQSAEMKGRKLTRKTRPRRPTVVETRRRKR
jgi:hypothetical protein